MNKYFSHKFWLNYNWIFSEMMTFINLHLWQESLHDDDLTSLILISSCSDSKILNFVELLRQRLMFWDLVMFQFAFLSCLANVLRDSGPEYLVTSLDMLATTLSLRMCLCIVRKPLFTTTNPVWTSKLIPHQN